MKLITLATVLSLMATTSFANPIPDGETAQLEGTVPTCILAD
jgi:hypothetical protein